MDVNTAHIVAGITLRDGGTTFMRGIGSTWVRPNVAVHGRYAVGGFDDTLICAQDEVGRYLQDYSRRIAAGECIGTWIDDDGDVHIDSVRLFDDLAVAMGHAARHGELAIYDMQNETVLEVAA